MAAAPLKSSTLFNIREEHFTPAMLAESEVFIETDQNDSSLMVLHKKGRVLFFQHNQFSQNSLNQFPGPEFLSEHIPMLERASKIVLAISTPDFTLVPAELVPGHDDERRKILLASGADIDSNDPIHVFHPTLSDYAILFSIPKIWNDWKHKLNTQDITCIPSAASFLHNLRLASKEQKTLAMIDVREGRFMLGLVKQNKMIHLNTFPYHTTEDFLYFLLASMEHHHLNGSDTLLMISGKIERSSPLIQGIHKYIKTTHMAGLPDTMLFSELFTELPAHYFHQFFQLKACVS